MSPNSSVVLDSDHNQIGSLGPFQQCSFADTVIIGQDFFTVTESQTRDNNPSLLSSGLTTSRTGCSEKTVTRSPSICDANYISTLHQQLSELKLIEQDLCWEQEKLEQKLESQLEEFRKTHESARHAVATKESEIHEHENLTKPLITLPPEILSLIFHHAISYIERPQSSCRWKTDLPLPLMMALVCRRWRTVIFGDPALWTEVNLAHAWNCNLQPYLSRSAGLPLTIGFHPSGSPPIRWSAVAWDQVVRESHRWGRLCMDLSNISADDIRALLSQKPAGSLTDIYLIDKRERSRHIRPIFAFHQNLLHTLVLVRFPMPKFLVAPRLQHLTFTAGWEDDHPELRVSCHRLRHTLLSATNLQTLALGVLSVTFGEQVQPILLPQLQRLTLYFYSQIIGPQLSNLLDMICAPALQIIELGTEEGCRDTSDDCDGYPGFMVGGKPRYPTVTTAILHNIINYGDDVEPLIEAFPSIKSLLINSFAVSLLWAYLRDLRHPPPETQWKDLQDIRLYVSDSSNADFKEFEFQSLRQVLAHRRFQGFPPLKAELLMDQKPTDAEHEKWLDALDSLCYLTISASSDTDDTNAPWRFWDAFGSSSRLPRLRPPIRHCAQRADPRRG